MKWRFVNHQNLLMAEGIRIAYLKDQHWPYGVESQILWMKKNIEMEDVHLMGEEQVSNNIVLRAYTTLSNINVELDNQNISCVGVGGVCVDKDVEHSGLGRLLLQEAEKYIINQDKLGILLCKESLTPFYQKCGWNELDYSEALVAGKKYDHSIMVLGEVSTCSNIVVDRNF